MDRGGHAGSPPGGGRACSCEEQPQREALGRAVAKAGISVLGVTEEALAAAVPYSLRLEDLNPRIAAVFDLGHAAIGLLL